MRRLVYNCLVMFYYLFVFYLIWQRHLGAYFSVFDCFMPCLLFDYCLPDLAAVILARRLVYNCLCHVLLFVCFFA